LLTRISRHPTRHRPLPSPTLFRSRESSKPGRPGFFNSSLQESCLIVASGISMRYGAKALFENVSVKFGGGNRYGLIGANGCGKSDRKSTRLNSSDVKNSYGCSCLE